MSGRARVLDFGGPVLLTPFEPPADGPGTRARGLLRRGGPCATGDHHG